MEHYFTENIKRILIDIFEQNSDQIFENSLLIQYINLKTRSADRGSKSRSSFGNLYAIYVLIEDYLNNNFHIKGKYKAYEGAHFSDLFKRQRELPFGSKLQNHHLNHRLNQEFRKYFPTAELPPIMRSNQKYWFNENLLKIKIGKRVFNIAETIIKIIDEYVVVKQSAFQGFIKTCEKLKGIQKANKNEAINFVMELLAPSVDARIFEIVSYSILKYFYHDQTVYFGFDLDDIKEENLTLYKTGRTNANDGGIDFVMKPLGRFFQVTETTDVRKYFLDIDKIERYPITFVIKSDESIDKLIEKIKDKAEEQYPVTQIVNKYLACIEEIINIPILTERFKVTVSNKYLASILDEIITQSKVEFHYQEDFD